MGIIIPPESEEAKPRPDCAVFEITLRCNFKCLHCGSSAGACRSQELTLDEIERIAEDLQEIGFRRVSLIGGEPFLRADWLEIAELLRRYGLTLTYVTNGSLFPGNPSLVEQVLGTEPQVIGFSVDGGTAETHDRLRGHPGAFEKVWKSIEIFEARGVTRTVITAVNRANIGELPLLRKRLRGRGAAWQIQICSHNGERFSRDLFLTREDYRALARFIQESAERFSTDELPIAGADDLGYFSREFPRCSINGTRWAGCKGGITNLGIQSNGGIKGCNSLPAAYVEGNIRTRRLLEIWNDPKAFAYSRHFKSEQLQGACASCEMGPRCKGGCVDIAHSICGHPFENTYCLRLSE